LNIHYYVLLSIKVDIVINKSKGLQGQHLQCLGTILICNILSESTKGPSWSYGSWIYNCLCNRCL